MISDGFTYSNSARCLHGNNDCSGANKNDGQVLDKMLEYLRLHVAIASCRTGLRMLAAMDPWKSTEVGSGAKPLTYRSPHVRQTF